MSPPRPLSGLAGLLLLLMVVTNGCSTPTDLYLGHRGNLYADRYIPLLHGQNTPPPLVRTTPQVVPGHNVSAMSIKDRDHPDATVIGISSFIVSDSPRDDPAALAQRLGADVVILTRTHVKTEQRTRMVPIELEETWEDDKGNKIKGKHEVLVPRTHAVNFHRYEACFIRTPQADALESQPHAIAEDSSP